jgi:poly(A) polymerase Pap1
VTRRKEDFFGEFFEMLKNHPQVSCLIPVSRAIVPIIKCDFDEYKLDIGFVSGDFDPNFVDNHIESLLYDDSHLKNMDENMIRSFNAFRNAHLVYNSVIKDIVGDLNSEESR